MCNDERSGKSEDWNGRSEDRGGGVKTIMKKFSSGKEGRQERKGGWSE